MSKPSPQQLARTLEREKGGAKLFAIIDCARDPAIFDALQPLKKSKGCLYEGAVPEVLARAAPHLAELKPGDPFLPMLLEQGFGASWGLLAISSASFEQLRKHFRRFLKVKIEGGGETYFRYYDPRIFSVYLPTCNREEADFVFGPVHCFLMEGEDGDSLLKFAQTSDGVEQSLVPLEG